MAAQTAPAAGRVAVRWRLLAPRVAPLLAACALLAGGCAVPAGAQAPPGMDDVLGPLDGVLGDTVPPLLDGAYGLLGENLTREDVRIHLWANMTKGDVALGGLLIGSGRAEVQAAIHGRLELRVVSTDRIRAALESENAYNVSAENATFLSEAYLPAEAFRATLTAEAIAAFQRAEEDALAAYLGRALPEMDILRLDFQWSNTSPAKTVTDLSLRDPPLVLELDLIVQYLRVESIASLLDAYLQDEPPEKEAHDAYVQRMKAENGTALRARDFFAAAAYTQLLNLSMQPGWSLDIDLHLPPGYSFTYFNDEVERRGERGASLHVDALTADADVEKVFLASITHRKAVALALLAALWVVGAGVALPFRFLYARYRLPRIP